MIKILSFECSRFWVLCATFIFPIVFFPKNSSAWTTPVPQTASALRLITRDSSFSKNGKYNQEYHIVGNEGSKRAASKSCLRRFAVPTADGSSSTSSSPVTTAPVLTVEGLSCTHNGGETWQLKDVDFNLQRGAKAALIGRNGTGKSTFLKILHESYLATNGLESSYSSSTNYKYTGNVQVPKTIRISMVDQEPPLPADITVGDAILGITTSIDSSSSINNSKSLMDVVRRYRIVSQQAETDSNYDADVFVKASADMDYLGGWDVLTKAEEIATKLKVNHLQDQPLSTLSGGERKRVALCAALVEEPDVLLLDEPTNFLSLAGVEWLADLLTDRNNNPKLTILMVTHDRAFLEQVCDQIVELDRGSLYEHPGSYSSYLQGKEERLAAEDAAIANAKSKYRVELEWMRKQPQARQSKSKARIEAFYKLEKSTTPRPRDPNLDLVQISNGDTRRIGTKIVSMKRVTLTFPGKNEGDAEQLMLDDFSYDFCNGDRICLAGANGVGKTTFTKLLTGELQPNNGEVEIGETVVLGVYDQLGLKFDEIAEKQTILEYVVDQIQSSDSTSMGETPGEARELLRQFEFPRSRWQERISVLSGGERRRLQILSVLSVKPNFLVLDEPSVDCDLDTLSALENYLDQFRGVLLVISHDRAFADKVTDHIFVFEGDGVIKDFQGSLSEYGSCLVELENQKIQDSVSSDSSESDLTTTKENYKEDRAKRNEVRNFIRQTKKEMTNIERSLEKLKPKAAEVQSEIDATSSDAGWTVLAELTDKLNAINDQIDEKELRWLELGEQLEEMDSDEIA